MPILPDIVVAIGAGKCSQTDTLTSGGPFIITDVVTAKGGGKSSASDTLSMPNEETPVARGGARLSVAVYGPLGDIEETVTARAAGKGTALESQTWIDSIGATGAGVASETDDLGTFPDDIYYEFPIASAAGKSALTTSQLIAVDTPGGKGAGKTSATYQLISVDTTTAKGAGIASQSDGHIAPLTVTAKGGGASSIVTGNPFEETVSASGGGKCSATFSTSVFGVLTIAAGRASQVDVLVITEIATVRAMGYGTKASDEAQTFGDDTARGKGGAQASATTEALVLTQSVTAKGGGAASATLSDALAETTTAKGGGKGTMTLVREVLEPVGASGGGKCA